MFWCISYAQIVELGEITLTLFFFPMRNLQVSTLKLKDMLLAVYFPCADITMTTTFACSADCYRDKGSIHKTDSYLHQCSVHGDYDKDTQVWLVRLICRLKSHENVIQVLVHLKPLFLKGGCIDVGKDVTNNHIQY